MDTKNFNLIDKTVAALRLAKVIGYVDKNDVILDFGCGSQGYFLKLASKKIKKGVGMDYDVDTFKTGNLEFIAQKATKKLPFLDKQFDKVFLLAVLEHIPVESAKELFLEFNRILKDKGTIVLTTPTPFGKRILEFLAYKLHIISEGEIRDHKKYYNKRELTKLAESSTLTLVSYKLFQFEINSCAIFKKSD